MIGPDVSERELSDMPGGDLFILAKVTLDRMAERPPMDGERHTIEQAKANLPFIKAELDCRLHPRESGGGLARLLSRPPGHHLLAKLTQR